MVRFTRTFHTVGQGAFYSEKIEYNDKQVFRMVYDCGSKSIPESLLAKRIKSDLANNVDIDILFISHFDKDHINGIYNLNPKLIIIPFLSKDQIFLLKLYNELYENVHDIKLAETPEELFQEAEVIRVLPDDSNNDDSNTFSEININIDQPHKRKNIKKLKSKSIIQLSTDVNSLWEYIPYNPNWNKYAESFKEKILEEDLDWEKLTNPSSNSSYIKKNLSILKNIYDKLGKKNLHSLIVYSNSTIDNCISIKFFSNKFNLYNKCLYNRFYHSGCIYFGDITFNSEIENSFYKFLSESKRLQKIGLLQVPHHGSIDSKGHKIISSNYLFRKPIICIISVGEFNQYGHPSAYLIQELQRNNGIVLMVTEASSTLIYLEGFI